MVNFYDETIEALNEANKLISEIVFIGSYDGEWGINPIAFKKLADVDYHAGYGTAMIPQDLVILFNDGTWLERVEYDGSEWWRHVIPPVKPASYKPIETFLSGDMYLPGYTFAKDRES